MKMFLFALTLLSSSLSFAGETVVLDSELPHRTASRTNVETSFYMDTETMEGYAKVSVMEERYIYTGGHYDHWGRWYPHYPMPVPTVVYKETVRVPGLTLVDNKVIYQSEEGEVDCGTFGYSRVFKVPTIYLSGNCELSGRVTDRGSRLIVKLNTK